MKRFLVIPVLFLALTVSGCGPGTKLGDLIGLATTSVTNPVDAVDIYRVKNIYAAALTGMDDYRTYCYSKPYASILADPVMKPVCQNRRGVIRTMQAYQPKAAAALMDAQTFVANNPTLNATTVISAAWQAVTNFKNAVPAQK